MRSQRAGNSKRGSGQSRSRPITTERAARSRRSPTRIEDRPADRAGESNRIEISPSKRVVFGRRPVVETIRAGRSIDWLYVSPAADKPGDLREIVVEARKRLIDVEQLPKHVLNRLAGGSNHQGVVAVLDEFPYCDLFDIVPAGQGEPSILLALDSIQDPHNFGSLTRTAEAIGIDGVVIPKHRNVAVTPGAVRASAGAVEHLKVARVTNLARSLRQLKESGYWIIGLSEAGDQVYDRIKYPERVVMVIGSEGSGLSPVISRECDFLVRVPMAGRIRSLNAAVAGSIVLYHLFRQLTPPESGGGEGET